MTIKENEVDICKKFMEGNDIDLVIIATSQSTVFHSAIKILKTGGTILLFGEPNIDCKLKIDVHEIYSKEISISSSYAASNEDIKESFSLINKKLINVEQLITHKFPIHISTEALNYAYSGKNMMKVMITNNNLD